MPSIGARKSQKCTDSNKKIEKALRGLRSNQFQSVHEAAKANDVSHSTLLRLRNGGKSIAESREPQQILTIPEENALTECITHLAIFGHPPKHAFIHSLAEEIRLSRSSTGASESESFPAFQPSIGDSWVQQFLYPYPILQTVYSCTIEAARKDVTKEDLDWWFE